VIGLKWTSARRFQAPSSLPPHEKSRSLARPESSLLSTTALRDITITMEISQPGSFVSHQTGVYHPHPTKNSPSRLDCRAKAHPNTNTGLNRARSPPCRLTAEAAWHRLRRATERPNRCMTGLLAAVVLCHHGSEDKLIQHSRAREEEKVGEKVAFSSPSTTAGRSRTTASSSDRRCLDKSSCVACEIVARSEGLVRVSSCADGEAAEEYYRSGLAESSESYDEENPSSLLIPMCSPDRRGRCNEPAVA